jgi:hypothetical protein
MIPPDLDPPPSSRRVSLIAVVDACVFPRRDWLRQIVQGAQQGHVVPIWSPLIVSEVTRFHTWRWLQENRGDLSRGARRDCSSMLKQWFAEMTTVFRVADDCPPHEETWASVRDAWDVPIWNAAKRSGADVIVTDNLRDGPPEDAAGRRVFQDVLWCHPDRFARMLERWTDAIAATADADRGEPDRTASTQAVLAVFDEAR